MALTDQGTKPPPFGTPEYTNWYYNDPAGPGYTGQEHPGPYQKPVPERKTTITESRGTTADTTTTATVKTTTGTEEREIPEVPQVSVEDYNKAMEALKPYEVNPGQYDIQGYLLEGGSPATTLTNLRNAGFSKEDISDAAHANLAEAEEMRAEANRPLYSKIWQGMTPWDESKGETASFGGALIMAGELLVPGVYTARHWDEMSGTEKGFSIVLDALILAPVVGAAGRGARGVTVAGRGARLAGAVKAVGKEALYTVRAPVDMIIHPVATAKSAVRSVSDFVENIAHPGKLPEAVVTTGEHTVKFRVNDATTPKQATQIRDKLMELASKGERPMVEVGGQTVELSRSPLMKELGGGLAHATPDIKILERAKVKVKPGMPAQEQGIFFAHEAPTRFTGGSAFGRTEKGTSGILVISPESAAKTVTSGKIYRSPRGAVTEMERVLPVGQTVPDIQQRLFTRVGPNKQRVEIWLEKPLTKEQIFRLKKTAIIEDLKAPFKPAITMKGTKGIGTLTETDTTEIIRILTESGNVRQAQALTRLSAAGRTAPRTIDDIVRGRVTNETVTGERIPRERSRDEVIRDVQSDIRRRAESEPERGRARREEERPEARRERAEREAERPDRERAEREAERPERGRERAEREEDRSGRGRERDEREGERPDRGEGRPPREPRETEPRGTARVPTRRTARKPGDEKKARPVLPDAEKGREQATFPKGTVAWKQGIGWWVFMPPYTGPADRVFVLKKPKGAEIATDARSAAGTIQSMGGPSAVNLKFDMGIVDVNLKDPPRQPSRKEGQKAIKFRRDTDKSYGGKRTKATSRSTRVGPYNYRDGALSKKRL